MRAITFSLIIAVVTASVSVGWLIDFTYGQLFSPPDSDIQKKISLLKHSGQAISQTIELQQDPQQIQVLLNQWNTHKDISVKLVNLDDIALPATLLEQLKSGEALLLENKEGASFSYYINESSPALNAESSTQIETLPERILQVSSDALFVEQAETGQLILTILFYLGLSLLLTAWVYPLAKRIFLIRQAATLFGQGNLDTRLEVGKVAGIKEVEVAFNSMASRIQTLLYDVKLLSGGVSHDLKTSLARLRFGIDTIEDDPDSLNDKQLARLSQDTDDMIHLVDMMLQYTQLDMELARFKKDAVDVVGMLKDIVSKLSQHGEHLELCLHINVKNEKDTSLACTKGDTEYLRMMLNNLISNAMDHALQCVEVYLDCTKKDILIRICDDGPGIPEPYQKDVFKPFYRVPELDNNSNNGGKQSGERHYGLGLAISQRIAQIHDGNITLESRSAATDAPTGTTFTIALPLVTQ